MTIYERALELVPDGAVIGLGSGRAAWAFVGLLGDRVRAGTLHVRGVPASTETAHVAAEHGVPLVELSDAGELALTVDGADEVDPQLNLIKGYGRALVREKIVAASSRQLIILVAQEKEPPYLVTIAEPDEQAIEWGRELNRQALRLYRRCVERDEWPGYDHGPTGIAQLRLPGWQVAAYEETVVFAVFTFWRAGGMMLVGMALFKLGVFSAARSRRNNWNILVKSNPSKRTRARPPTRRFFPPAGGPRPGTPLDGNGAGRVEWGRPGRKAATTEGVPMLRIWGNARKLPPALLFLALAWGLAV